MFQAYLAQPQPFCKLEYSAVGLLLKGSINSCFLAFKPVFLRKILLKPKKIDFTSALIDRKLKLCENF